MTARSARNLTRGTIVAEDVNTADTVLARMRGLIGRRTWRRGDGLLLAPCRGVHMFFMRFPLDLLFLDRHNRVVCTVSGLPVGAVVPWIRGAERVLELPVGTVHESRTAVGDMLSIEARAAATAA
jgi:uncharacterized membrane protein (UPF0127 family)